MSAALKLNLEDAKLSQKPPLGEKRPMLKLVWENPKLSADSHREKSKAKLSLVSGQTLYAYVKGDPVNLTDLWGLIWKTIGTRHPWTKDAGKWWFNRWVQQIGHGMDPTMPGANPKEFEGTTRDLIQKWVPDPNDPSRDCEHKFGQKRTVQQTWGPVYDEWQGKTIYTWRPIVPNTTYQNY